MGRYLDLFNQVVQKMEEEVGTKYEPVRVPSDAEVRADVRQQVASSIEAWSLRRLWTGSR